MSTPRSSGSPHAMGARTNSRAVFRSMVHRASISTVRSVPHSPTRRGTTPASPLVPSPPASVARRTWRSTCWALTLGSSAGRSRTPPRRAPCGSRRAGRGSPARSAGGCPCGCRQGAPRSGGRTETLAVVAHEVEHRAHRFPWRPAQSSAELLQEQHRAVGGAQQQQRVDHGDIDALVEQVDREHRLHPTIGQVAQRRLALVGGAVTPHRHCSDPRLVEHPSQPGRWSTLTQNPSARIVRTSSTPECTSNTACRAQASLAV